MNPATIIHNITHISLIALAVFTTLQIFNVVDTDLAPIFTPQGRTALFVLITVALLGNPSPSAIPIPTIFLAVFIPTALYAEHIKDRLLRKTRLSIDKTPQK